MYLAKIVISYFCHFTSSYIFVRQCPATLLYHICGSNSVLFHFGYTFVNIISHKCVYVCKCQLLFLKSHSLAVAGFLNV